jgi:hypothetical protein
MLRGREGVPEDEDVADISFEVAVNVGLLVNDELLELALLDLLQRRSHYFRDAARNIMSNATCF